MILLSCFRMSSLIVFAAVVVLAFVDYSQAMTISTMTTTTTMAMATTTAFAFGWNLPTKQVVRSIPTTTTSTTTKKTILWSQQSDREEETGEGKQKEVDLFDYFDPLLSPHAYPNGISPKNKPNELASSTSTTTASTSSSSTSTSWSSSPKPFGIDIYGSTTKAKPLEIVGEEKEEEEEIQAKEAFSSSSSSSSFSSTSNNGDSPDLFDYFDPLKSPHEYPNGIVPNNNKNRKNAQSVPSTSSSKQYTINVFGMDRVTTTNNNQEQTQSSNTNSNNNNNNNVPDLFDYFDPLKSPHEYPNGIVPNNNSNNNNYNDYANASDDDREFRLSIGKNTKPNNNVNNNSNSNSNISNDNTVKRVNKVGILLMDHGSRNEASNQRLKNLAELYQWTLANEEESTNKQKTTTNQFFVQAAHMEIASPSIPEGLQRLLQEGVDEIVCHPYFLSPGRHVREDIPEIVNAAIESLQIKIPVVTTDPVGSNTQLMIGAIHSSVKETSQILGKQQQQK